MPGRVAFADDKLYLKTGEVLEGTITEENAVGVKIQVRTGTIKETKSFPRDQVDRVERPKPDDVALKGVQALVPTPPLLDVAGYRPRIESAQRFLSDFPDSQHRQTVQEILDALQGEFAQVSAGAIKGMSGEWISAEEKKAHQENVDAEIQLAKIIQMGRGGAYLQALRAIEELRVRYPKTKASAESISVAINLMKSYGRSLTQSLNERRAYEAAYEERKARLSPAEIQAYENELAQRALQISALNEREKAAGVKWPTPNLENGASIEGAIKNVQKHIASLEKVDAAALKAEAAALYEVESLMAQGQLELAEANLRAMLKTRSKTLASKDPHIARVIQDLNAAGEEKSKTARLAELERAKEDSSSKPVVIATSDKAAGEASAEDALDALMAERPATAVKESEKPASAAAKEKPSKSKTSSKAKSSGDEGDDEEDSAGERSRPAPVTGSGGGLSVTMIMGIVFALLLAVTGGIYFIDKKRKAGAGDGGE